MADFDYSKLADLGVLGGLGLYNANRAKQDANKQIEGLQSMQNLYAQDSPYAQNLRQTLERKDAAAGRRSQYGPREVELQGRLADAASRQQASTAPLLNQLYQQKQKATNSAGRDIATVLAKSGGFSKLSPAVRSLFKRRGDGFGENAGAGMGTGSLMGSSEGPMLNTTQTYDSYDYGGGNDYYSDLGVGQNYDSYDFGSGGGDYYSDLGVGQNYDSFDFGGSSPDFSGMSDFESSISDFDIPGFAKGGKVDIFQALADNRRARNNPPPQGQTKPINMEQPYHAPMTTPPKEDVGTAGSDAVNGMAGMGSSLAGTGVPGAIGLGNTVAGLSGIGSVPGLNGTLGLAGAPNNSSALSAAAMTGLGIVSAPLALAVSLLSSLFSGSGGGGLGNAAAPGAGIGSVVGSLGGGGDSGMSGEAGIGGALGGALGGMGDVGGGDSGGGMGDAGGMGGGIGDAAGGIGGGDSGDGGGGVGDGAGGGIGGAFATGGKVRGPGTGTSDSIVAKLSNGEFVSTAHTVSTLGDSLFEKLEKKAKQSPVEVKKFKKGLAALF